MYVRINVCGIEVKIYFYSSISFFQTIQKHIIYNSYNTTLNSIDGIN